MGERMPRPDWSSLHRIILSLGLASALWVPTAEPASSREAPRRVLSLNLCADQYLLALADPRQIAGLTPFARDPAMSPAVEQARGLPVSRGTAEDIVALGPDLVIVRPGRRKGLAAAPDGRHATLELAPARSYAEIVAQVRQVAAAVGHPDRGEALVRRMDAELAALPRLRRGGVAAYYQRRGYLTGTGSLVDDLMHRAGLTNLAARLGRTALSRLTLEQLVAARPDYLIVEDSGGGITDQGTEMLDHPALRSIPRLRVPQAWTVCGGPAYVNAARSLVEQINAR